MDLSTVQNRLREIAELAIQHRSDYRTIRADGFPTELHGYSEAEICLAVYKKALSPAFTRSQADYMEYLGEEVCPKIYTIDKDSYCMEFLFPAIHHIDSLIVQERMLKNHVWIRDPTYMAKPTEMSWRKALLTKISVDVPDWALEPISVIHGDPTCDNVLATKDGHLRFIDPIPPLWLNKPSIRAVDCGKMLQSFLGWEVVLRGVEPVQFAWPEFMRDFDSAKRAVFWAMVAIKRLIYRDISDAVTLWAVQVDKELVRICEHLS